MENVKIQIDCLPLSHLCHVGEQVCFHISADRKIPLEVELSVDAETILQKCTVMPPAALSASLPFPGFPVLGASRLPLEVCSELLIHHKWSPFSHRRSLFS